MGIEFTVFFHFFRIRILNGVNSLRSLNFNELVVMSRFDDFFLPRFHAQPVIHEYVCARKSFHCFRRRFETVRFRPCRDNGMHFHLVLAYGLDEFSHGIKADSHLHLILLRRLFRLTATGQNGYGQKDRKYASYPFPQPYHLLFSKCESSALTYKKDYHTRL